MFSDDLIRGNAYVLLASRCLSGDADAKLDIFEFERIYREVRPGGGGGGVPRGGAPTVACQACVVDELIFHSLLRGAFPNMAGRHLP